MSETINILTAALAGQENELEELRQEIKLLNAIAIDLRRDINTAFRELGYNFDRLSRTSTSRKRPEIDFNAEPIAEPLSVPVKLGAITTQSNDGDV
jgi:hypothetical protein